MPYAGLTTRSRQLQAGIPTTVLDGHYPRQTEASVEGCPGLKRITYRNGRSVWAYRFADPLTSQQFSIWVQGGAGGGCGPSVRPRIMNSIMADQLGKWQ